MGNIIYDIVKDDIYRTINRVIESINVKLVVIMVIIFIAVYVIRSIKVLSKKKKILKDVLELALTGIFFYCCYLIFRGLPYDIREFFISSFVFIFMALILFCIYLIGLSALKK